MFDLQNLDFGEKLGFSEMYEWGERINSEFPFHCKLVQFDEKKPHCIIRARNTKNIVGISSIGSGYKASNPDTWPFKYIINEYGDLYLKRTDIGEASKKYDSISEMTYLETHKKNVILPVINPNYNNQHEYIKRSNRSEWCSVTILGKAIIEDNGECIPGQYCTLYQGNDNRMIGTVIPAKKTDKFKLYVLNRLSPNTIMVLFTPKI